MKQAIKKGTGIKKKGGLSAYKKKIGLEVSSDNIVVSNADKPMEWLMMPKAFNEATRLPGFPMGYVSMIGGFSDTGKTTIINLSPPDTKCHKSAQPTYKHSQCLCGFSKSQ